MSAATACRGGGGSDRRSCRKVPRPDFDVRRVVLGRVDGEGRVRRDENRGAEFSEKHSSASFRHTLMRHSPDHTPEALTLIRLSASLTLT